MAGMCKKCGHVVNELNSNELCPTCASYNKKAEEDRKKKEDEEKKKKIWDSLTEEERAEWWKNEAEAAKERAEKRLASHQEEVDVKRAEYALRRALVRLDIKR